MKRFCLLTDLDNKDKYMSLLEHLENKKIYSEADLNSGILESLKIIEDQFPFENAFQFIPGNNKDDLSQAILSYFRNISESFDNDIMFSLLCYINHDKYVKLSIYNDEGTDKSLNKSEEHYKDYYRLARESLNYIATHSDSVPYNINIIKRKNHYNEVLNIAPNVTRWLLIDKQFRALYKTNIDNCSKYETKALCNILNNLDSFKFLKFDQDDLYIINRLLNLKLARQIYLLLQDVYNTSNVLFDNQLNKKFIRLIINLPSREMQILMVDSIKSFISDDNCVFIRNTISEKYKKFKHLVEELNIIVENGLTKVWYQKENEKYLSYQFKEGMKINDIYEDIARKKLCLKWKEHGFDWSKVLEYYNNSFNVFREISVQNWKAESKRILKTDQLYQERIWSFILKTIISESISSKSH